MQTPCPCWVALVYPCEEVVALGEPVRELMVLAAEEVSEGAGARVRRLMPSPLLPHLDPFVLFDHATVAPPAGFPAHPHRGFEIVTYMLEGAFAHWDDAGHEEIVSAGGSQRITAGRGIVHSEMPVGPGPARGLQLWINLPRVLKDLPPDYQTVPAAAIPEEARDGARLRHVVGGGSPIALRTAGEAGAGTDGARVALVCGRPHGEPILLRGPYVL